MNNSSPENLERMTEEANRILREELKKGIIYDESEIRIYDHIRTVGVQGDYRTYGRTAEVVILKNDSFIWDSEFNSRLSNRICNEIEGINRVVYFIG